ncbi:MAG: hypothetical protein AB7P33_18880 [Dehalococcoidia bacterium]
MAATTAVKAGIISAAAGLVLVVGAFAVTSTMAGAQTPTPDTQEQQQTTPATPQDGTTPKGPMNGTHEEGDCPGMEGSGGGMRGHRPGADSGTEDGSSSSGTSFQGFRGGGPRS